LNAPDDVKVWDRVLENISELVPLDALTDRRVPVDEPIPRKAVVIVDRLIPLVGTEPAEPVILIPAVPALMLPGVRLRSEAPLMAPRAATVGPG
jgi:hypothetical protein